MNNSHDHDSVVKDMGHSVGQGSGRGGGDNRRSLFPAGPLRRFNFIGRENL